MMFLGGYFLLLNVDVHSGLAVKIVGNAILFPWLYKNKVWDGIVVVSLLTTIDIHKLFTVMMHH